MSEGSSHTQVEIEWNNHQYLPDLFVLHRISTETRRKRKNRPGMSIRMNERIVSLDNALITIANTQY